MIGDDDGDDDVTMLLLLLWLTDGSLLIVECLLFGW